MHRKCKIAAVALVAVLAGGVGANADNGGGGGGGGGSTETLPPGNFFAQNTNDVGPLEAERRRREYEKRVADSVNNQGRVPPAAPSTQSPRPPATTAAPRVPVGPPPIPANEAESTVRLAGGDTLFTRPLTERAWEATFGTDIPEGGPTPPRGWTQRLRLPNGWTIYSGYGDRVYAVSPTGIGMSRYLR